MAGIGLETGEARRALDSVAEILDSDHGIVLLQPAYSRYHRELGEISTYPPPGTRRTAASSVTTTHG